MELFKTLVGDTVVQIFLVVWPPWGEEHVSAIDISIGLVFKEKQDELCVIGIDKDELWSPHAYFEKLPEKIYAWEDFHPRMTTWMNSEDEDLIIGKEYYNVTNSELFKNIRGNIIEGLEFLSLVGFTEPFGLKIIFKNDFILSLPNFDGSTFQTREFNNNGRLEYFEQLGKIVHWKI
jgi:hypothetical protein